VNRRFWKYTAAVLLAAAICGLCSAVFAANGLPQKSTLDGTVVAESLARPGQKVREGEVLVKVKTIVGSMAAARATVSGTVSSVLVKPGDRITSGQTVAEIGQ